MLNSKITPFLMFEGQAEEAMNYYTSIFEPSEITRISRYGANEVGDEGSVQQATFCLKGQTFMCIDSNIKHEFSFTPAISLFVTCDSDEEISEAFDKLSAGGSVLMPLAAYPFANKFGWVQDKYGISWQLSF
ncbi:VOC family protein [Paenibacillus dokdonensis]|uniref:VOC family protein n=1 Tax=Paenibacillus dokdonensis TaxID=2567944 RepID=UPI0010A89648|nr:VOC family protein [Paenibacillus dokdonensis]